MIYFSRHNRVRAVHFGGQPAVRKHFANLTDWQTELDALHRLTGRVAVPRVLEALPGFLLLERLPCPTLLDELEGQESSAFRPAPWQALCRWLRTVHASAGLVPTDGNLRNFLWDNGQETLFGVDFEHYRPGRLDDALCQVAAFILEYNPSDTPVKRQAAQALTEHLGPVGEQIALRRAMLRERRASKRRDSLGTDFSFILLAGGQSRRMGRDKASLDLLGATLLESQLEKAQMLGVDDVLLSGVREVPGVRCIPDELPDRGPLGGLHACIRQARHEHCIVLGVDTPLLPADALRELATAHLRCNKPITLAVHGEKLEPLVGVYSSALSHPIERLIRDGGAPVRALLRENPWQSFHTELPEVLWSNCNTPEEYQALKQIKIERK